MSIVARDSKPRAKRRAARAADRIVPGLLEARRLMALTTIFSENFDGLAFGPNQEEARVGEEVWTNVPPAGWVKDDSGVPGWDNPPDNNGITEWIGWTFAQKDWWVPTAGDQTRSLFEAAEGGVMIADDDEWDDGTHPGTFSDTDELYTAKIETASISLAGVTPGTAVLDLDSSWRPEGFDDGANINNQTGIIEAVYSDGSV